MVGVVVDHLEGGPRGAQDLLQELALFLVTEGDRDAVASGTRSAADAVDVAFGLIREVEVHDVGDLVDVDTASGDVGRNQDGDAAGAEALEGRRAGALRLVAVDGSRGESVVLQILDHLVRAMLGAGEDEGALHIGHAEDVLEELALLVLAHVGKVLVDALDGGARGRDLDPNGVFEEGACEVGDLGRHGCREEEVLPAGRHEAHDPLHIGEEAHVEHAVGFIEDEVGEVAKVDEALRVQVEQPSGRGDEHIDAAAERIHLGADAHTAEDDGGLDGEAGTVGIKPLCNLGRQFAGGGEDQCTDGARITTGLGSEALEHGEGEGGCLSRARLGNTEEVSAGKQRRNRLVLNRSGSGVALVGQRAQKGLDEPEIGERIQVVPKKRSGRSA